MRTSKVLLPKVLLLTVCVAAWGAPSLLSDSPFATGALATDGWSSIFGVSRALAESAKKSEEPAKKKKKKKRVKKAATEPQAELKPKAIGEQSSFGNVQFDQELAKPNSVDAILLLDASGSMQRTDPARLRIQAAKLFLRFLGEGDRVAIFQFDQEVKQILPFTNVSPESIAAIDKTLEETPADGFGTDLEAPVSAALSLLRTEPGSKSVKSVVLLSDGQMDPGPGKPTPQELIDKLNQSVLPEYRMTGTRLYTVAMSPEADRELLQSMAEATDGLNWFAPTVQSLHTKFSDLFLALKKPQVSPLEGGGFEIDPSVREATFFINRKEPDQQISLVDPKGQGYSTGEFPPNVKWYRAELFDVVTVSSPLPGRWGIQGVENPEGFATLVTDLQVQVRWPQNNLKIGDSVAFFARLIADGKPFHEPGMKDITFYQYKIVNTRKGDVVSSGTMNDAGKDGDEKAGDGIYSAKVHINEPGEHRAFVGVTSPTFTRQQHVPFRVSEGLVELSLVEGDEFAGTHSGLKINLSETATELQDLDVRVLIEKDGEEKVTSLRAEKSKTAGVYELSAEKLPPGTLQLSARVVGKDPKTKKSVTGLSQKIEYTSAGKAGAEEAVPELEEVELLEESTEPVDRSWIGGLVAFLLAVVWSGGLVFYVKKKLDFGKGLPERQPRYERPASLLADLVSIQAQGSHRKRPPTPEDFVVFELARPALDLAAKKAGVPTESQPQESA